MQVEGEQFVGAISEALEPRMRLTGEMATLEKFNVSSCRQCADGHPLHTCASSVDFPVASLCRNQVQCVH